MSVRLTGDWRRARRLLTGSANKLRRGMVAAVREEAKRALTEGKVVTLEPMNPRDRRVIHLSLAKLPGITTESSGHGARRRVQIIPSTKKR